MIELLEQNLGLVTILLAIATFWLAISTRKAANASKNMFELESRPYLVFSKPIFRLYIKTSDKKTNQIKSQTLKLGVEFKNPSKVPVKYQIKSMKFTFDSRTVEEPKYMTDGGLIYPNDYGFFWFGGFSFNDELSPTKSGIIEYELEYSSTDFHKKYFKKEKMRYILNSLDPYNCDWSYIEDGIERVI